MEVHNNLHRSSFEEDEAFGLFVTNNKTDKFYNLLNPKYEKILKGKTNSKGQFQREMTKTDAIMMYIYDIAMMQFSLGIVGTYINSNGIRKIKQSEDDNMVVAFFETAPVSTLEEWMKSHVVGKSLMNIIRIQIHFIYRTIKRKIPNISFENLTLKDFDVRDMGKFRNHIYEIDGNRYKIENPCIGISLSNFSSIRIGLDSDSINAFTNVANVLNSPDNFLSDDFMKKIISNNVSLMSYTNNMEVDTVLENLTKQIYHVMDLPSDIVPPQAAARATTKAVSHVMHQRINTQSDDDAFVSNSYMNFKTFDPTKHFNLLDEKKVDFITTKHTYSHGAQRVDSQRVKAQQDEAQQDDSHQDDAHRFETYRFEVQSDDAHRDEEVDLSDAPRDEYYPHASNVVEKADNWKNTELDLLKKQIYNLEKQLHEKKNKKKKKKSSAKRDDARHVLENVMPPKQYTNKFGEAFGISKQDEQSIAFAQQMNGMQGGGSLGGSLSGGIPSIAGSPFGGSLGGSLNGSMMGSGPISGPLNGGMMGSLMGSIAPPSGGMPGMMPPGGPMPPGMMSGGMSGMTPPGMMQPGMSGAMPPGMMPPGMMSGGMSGAMPPGMMPPGMMPGGMYGGMPPGMMPPGGMMPGGMYGGMPGGPMPGGILQ